MLLLLLLQPPIVFVVDFQLHLLNTFICIFNLHNTSNLLPLLPGRNEAVNNRALTEVSSLEEGTGRLDEQLGGVRLTQSPSVIGFMPYSSTLAVASRDMILLLDKEKHGAGPSIVSSWSNQNPRFSQVTA